MRLLVTIFTFILLSIALGECVTDRVLLRDVNTITLREGQYTTGRRSSPVPQLRCVGGSARGKFQPRAAQCFKEGFDGVDYQWRCVADMPADYEFGEIAVTCEGYDYPEDPFILKGSCGLEYELEYSHSARNVGKSAPRAPPRSGGFGGGFDGGPGFGGGYPGMHPPPSAPPPSYDDTMGFKTSAPTGSAPGSSGPGFWTGAGLGALGGYLFGRNTGGSSSGMFDSFRGSRRVNDRFMRDTGFDDHDADQPSTSYMRESTGYGGTRRR